MFMKWDEIIVIGVKVFIGYNFESLMGYIQAGYGQVVGNLGDGKKPSNG